MKKNRNLFDPKWTKGNELKYVKQVLENKSSVRKIRSLIGLRKHLKKYIR